MKVRATVLAFVLIGTLGACRGGDTPTDSTGTKTDFGVTKEPCPQAIDKAKGCIYLGTLSDLTEGPFRALAVSVTEAQKAFWARVNKAGGIGGYEIDATTYVRDNKYNPQVHAQVYQEIKPKVLALAQTLGSATTAAVLPDMRDGKVVAAPAAWNSDFVFEDVILESGANYCIEAINSIDYGVAKYNVKSVMAVHFPNDYGKDAAAGAKIAAAKLGLTFKNVQTGAGAEAQAGAIAAIVAAKPDLVIVTTGPTEAAQIIGGAATQGFKGRFIGTSPTWNPALLKSPAAAAMIALYEQSAPWEPWGTDTPGHKAMRGELSHVTAPNEGFTSGWIWSYPLKAALTKAAADKDLTRAGLLAAAKSLTTVDYEGMLPPEYAPGKALLTSFNRPDAAGPTGLVTNKAPGTGPTAQAFKLEKPCHQQL